MMDIRRMMESMSATMRDTRSDYHLTLMKLVEFLEGVEPDLPIQTDTGHHVHELESYRGYYADLSFPPADERHTCGEVLKKCKAALGSEFTGYKGGQFRMDDDTPLWVSPYGEASGQAITDVELRGGVCMLITKQVED